VEIKEIGIDQPRIPDIAVLPIRNNIPTVEPLAFNFPKPIIDLPCVEAREDFSTKEVFNFDKGSYSTFCDFKFGSFNPPILTPSVINKLSDEQKDKLNEDLKKQFEEQARENIKSMSDELSEMTEKETKSKTEEKEKKETTVPKNMKLNPINKRELELALNIPLDCPPIDALPIGALGSQQTKRVKAYVRDIEGECQTVWQNISIAELAQNFTPPGSQVLSVAATTFVSATVVLAAKPASSILLKIVKPATKKIAKKIFKLIGKKEKIQSYNERKLAQRDKNRAIMALRRSLKG
tara:strand:- start:646 stop:1527 length:882 start_codon:yes stop_codon:yes gene_type:complete